MATALYSDHEFIDSHDLEQQFCCFVCFSYASDVWRAWDLDKRITTHCTLGSRYNILFKEV